MAGLGLVSWRREPLVWLSGGLAIVLAWILFWPEPKLIVWPDSLGYLGPALDALEHGHFSHWYGRGSGYALLLWGLLSLSPNPLVIAIGQRLIVILTFLVLAAAVRHLTQGVDQRDRRTRALVAALAGFWLLVYVLYPPVAGLAHTVMAETLFGLLLAVVAAGVAILASGRAHRIAGITIAIVLASIALAFVKPHWLLGAVTLPLALPFIAPPECRRRVVLWTAASLAIGMLAFPLPEYRLRQRYDPYMSAIFGPRTLFCNSSDAIREYLASQRDDAFAAEVSADLSRVLSAEARAAASDWALLGFNGDDCMYGETGRLMTRHFDGRPDAEVRYYFSTYASAVATRPGYVVNRIARHAWSLAAKPFNAVAGEYFLRADSSTLLANRGSSALLNRWSDEHASTFSGLVDLPTRRSLLALRVFFEIAGLSLTALVAAAVVVVASQRPMAGLRRSFSGIAFCGLALNLLIVLVHTFEPRYIAMQMPLFTLLGFTASLVVLERINVRHLR